MPIRADELLSTAWRSAQNGGQSGPDLLRAARLLLAQVIERPVTWLMAHPDSELSDEQAGGFEALWARFLQGDPLPYLLGHWEFFGLDFLVTPDVLIPRPETELLVEKALAWLRANPARRAVVDVGTGSGCIAVSLAANIHDLVVTATDISPAAIAVARMNIERHGVGDRVTAVCCDLMPAEEKGIDLIVANLPYIPSATLMGLDVYGREPALALDGGTDGLEIIRRLVKLASRRLEKGGLLLLEIEATQGLAAVSLAYDIFSHADIQLHRDYSGHDRLVEIQKHGWH